MSKPPVLCRLWGHAIDAEAADHYCVYYCERCHEQVDPDRGPAAWLRRQWHSARYAIRDRIFRFRAWLTCTECGKHFGRHDREYDHIPF